MYKQARRLDVLGHVRQHPLHTLKIGNLLAELLALLCIAQGCGESGLPNSHCQSGNAHPSLVEHTHHQMKAPAFIAKQSLAGECNTVEGQCTNLADALAHLVFLRFSIDTL